MKRGLILFASLWLSACAIQNSQKDTGEFVGTYGLWRPPSDTNSTYSSSTSADAMPAVPALQVVGADLTYQIVKQFFVGGLRYESFSATSPTGTSTYVANGNTFGSFNTHMTGSRLAVLLGARKTFAPSWHYVGVVGSYGFSQKATMTVANRNLTQGTSPSTDYSGTVAPSYSVGVDGAFRFQGFILGAEAGYLVFKVTEWTSAAGQILTLTGPKLTSDFSGVYYRGFFGFSF